MQPDKEEAGEFERFDPSKTDCSQDELSAGNLVEDVEPWPEKVDGANLLEQLVTTFSRFLALPDGAAEAMAFWCFHTFCLDAFQITPRLTLLSPEKRCGKTTAMMLIGQLVNRPLSTSNITAAALFRTIEAVQPTLILDETDTFIWNSDDLRGVLNSGHNRLMSYVIRTTGDHHNPKPFSTWAPVAIAAIGKIPDTLEDRSVVIRMRRKSPAESVERFRGDRVEEFAVLQQKMRRWANDNILALRSADPDVPEKLHDRAADNWRPLLAIADRCGGAWPETARRIACSLSDGMDDSSHSVQLLEDIRAIIGTADRISSADLITRLTNLEDRPWCEWRNGKPMSTVQLARLLKPFGITPSTKRFNGGRSAKGYSRQSMEDAFSRYLESDPSRRNKSQKPASSEGFQGVTRRNDVTDQNDEKPAENCVLLRRNGSDTGCAVDNHDFVLDVESEERAAIMQYDGGVSVSALDGRPTDGELTPEDQGCRSNQYATTRVR